MSFATRSTIAKGTQLNGIYEIDEPLATGGMGEVYRGHAIQTGDVVAIKLIRTDLAEDDSALALFRREASALHSIHHEAIVRYFVFSVDPILQRPYLAMEFVEGEALSDILRQGPLPLADVMALKERIASGLHAAHLRGIVHRDISPDNIIVDHADFAAARIIDFGIARSTKPGDATVIGSGFAGKFNYVSPEQLGLFNGDVTARSDIYSLGLVLAYACRGKPLDMGGSQVDVIEKRRNVPDLQDIYPPIRPLIARMLQPDPGLRPANMREVADWRIKAAAAAEERTVIKLRPAPGPAATPDSAAHPAPALPGGPAVAFLPEPGAAGARADQAAPGRKPLALWGGLALGLAVASLLAAWFFSGRGGTPDVAKAPQAETPTNAAPAPPKLESAPFNPKDAGLSGRQKSLAFILHHDAGPCAFLAPIKVTEDSAAVAGFGVDAAPFEAFDKAFKQANRFEADIEVHQITRAQCPAVDFLSRVGAGAGNGPALSLRSSTIRSGDVLAGAVDSDLPHLELIIVDDDGRAYNVTSQIRDGGASRAFAMRLQKAASARAHPMLLIAVASASPIPALKPGSTLDAGAFFRAVSEEMRGQSGVKASALYFQVE
jgi:serine/threonine-protein kinase